MTSEEVVLWLRRGRYRIGSEALLQISIEDRLKESGVSFDREFRLGPGERIDFLVAGGIGIEAKVRCPARKVYRQLERYARYAEISALILISATATGLPPRIDEKPLFLVSLGRTAL